MKKIPILLLAVLLIGFGASPASATAVLYDWYIDVNGDVYEVYPDTYLPPVVGGEITAVTGFNMFIPAGDPYGHDVPNASGSLTVTFDPGVAGDYYISSYFDIEVDEWVNGWDNEEGGVNGTAASSQYGSIFHPWDDPGDIAWIMGWDVTLGASNEYAVITFDITDQEPVGGFYLSQTDPDSGDAIYFSSSLDIQGGDPGTAPVPEPATILLLGSGIAGLIGVRKKKFLSKT